MSLKRSTSIKIPAAVKILNRDGNQFQNIVYDFIERITNELLLYDDNSEFDLSASAFRQIELQIQAQRIEKVLELCISKIRLVFFVSQLNENQRDHLTLFFQPLEVECITNFNRKWFGSDINPLNSDFNVDLNKCLNAANRTDIKIKAQSVSLFYFHFISSVDIK